MAGLSALLLALCAWLADAADAAAEAQEPTPPPGHLERIRALLAAPAPQDAYWRETLFHSITRLEHAPAEDLYPAFALLAEDGGDRALSNLVLYSRRQGLPLPAVRVGEGADPALERALAAWGEGDLDLAGRLLEHGAATWPADSRWADNLLWLRGEAPESVSAGADARMLAYAVLAAREANR